MKNLNKTLLKYNFAEIGCGKVFCVALNSLYFVRDNSLCVLNLKESTFDTVCDFQNLVADNTSNAAQYLEYCSETDQFVIVYSGGEIISVNVTEAEGKLVGAIDNGVAAACFSPGEDLLALVTSNHSIVLLSQDLEPLTETDLFGEDDEQSVNVGWGSKETQFRGTEGKLKATQEVPTVKLARDDGKVRISWRGDGERFVVSLIRDGNRYLKVVSRDGTLLHTSDLTVGLESAISWRPSGNLIASTQRLPNKHIVCFFEKNALPHGDFELAGDVTVRELLWSGDSTILAAVLENSVHFYTTSNYTWYHKNSLHFKEGEELVFIVWDKLDTGLLHVGSKTGGRFKYAQYNFRATVAVSSGESTHDDSIAAVINGPRVLLTNFRKAIVPPPMHSSAIQCNLPVSAVGFLQFGAADNSHSSNSFFIQLANFHICLYRFDKAKNQYEEYEKIDLDHELYETAWVDGSIFLGSGAGNITGYCLEDIRPDGNGKIDASQCAIDHNISFFRRVPGTREVLTVTDTNTFYSYNLDKPSSRLTPWSALTPKSIGKLQAVEVRQNSAGDPVVCLLDTANRLYVNGSMLANNVTSLRLLKDVLMVTTSQHKLVFWSLDDPTATAGVTERPVERGSRIVTAIAGSSKVVLQLPRGNLEVIQPRALSLARLKEELDNKKFAEAYAVMRRERINLNLLYDHNPQLFIENIGHFIEEVKDPTFLCTFIADLCDKSVTSSTYSQFYKNGLRHDSQPDKISRICSLMIANIEERDDREALLLPVLSCLIKEAKIEEALLRVKALRDAEKTGKQHLVSSTDGLRHIMYFIDIEQLFKYALGTYDFDLVKFIASKSQKDPKEYIPFLSNLQEMEINYQRYTIDKFLKKFKSALSHLVKCENRLAECLKFIETHSLHKDSISLFPTNSHGYKSVCTIYGNLLTEQKRHDEAGTMYLRALEYNLALYAFTRSGNWRQVIACSSHLNYTDDQLKDMFATLAGSLKDERRHEEAAQLFIEYMKDITSGVVSLSAGGLFEEACRVARAHGQADLIRTKVLPSAISAAETLTQTIQRLSSTFTEQSRRLIQVRSIREKSDGGVDWDDTGSESSRGSSRSSSSTRSAKNSRKLERKLVSLKEGGPFEDVALTSSLHDIVTQAAGLKTQVRSLNLSLLLLDQETIATNLQASLATCMATMTDVIPSIWTDEPASEDLGPNATSNSLAAAFVTPKKKLPPAVRALQPKILCPPNTLPGVNWELSLLKIS